jgi:hypothetical protein
MELVGVTARVVVVAVAVCHKDGKHENKANKSTTNPDKPFLRGPQKKTLARTTKSPFFVCLGKKIESTHILPQGCGPHNGSIGELAPR